MIQRTASENATCLRKVCKRSDQPKIDRVVNNDARLILRRKLNLLTRQPADYFIACYTVLTRPIKVETAVHGCNSWLSVWTLSCRCPVKLSTWYQPCIVCYSVYFWLIRSFTDPTFIGSIFVCGPLHHHVPNRFSVWVIPRFAFE